MFHAAVVSIVALTLPLLEDGSATLLTGGILSAPSYLILGIMEARQTALLFSPLSFYFLWYAVGLGPCAIYLASVTWSGESVPFSIAVVPPDDLAVGYVIYLVGSVALHAGLQAFRPLGRGDRKVNRSGLPNGRLLWLVVLWAVGLWILWNPAWIAPLGAPGGTLRWGSLAALSAFALIPREQFRLSRLTFSGLLAVGTAGLFIANLMSGSKAYLMFSFLPVVWLFLIRPPLRRWLPVAGMGLLVFYLALVAPVVTLSRYTPLQEGESLASRLVETLRHWSMIDVSVDSSFYGEQLQAFLTRQFDPISVGYLVGEVRNTSFQFGGTMQYAAYAFIPRIFWPDKPAVTRGAWFTSYIGFSRSEEEATTATGITATGELYWNFGMAAVVIGMFTVGCLLGGLWRMAGADPRQDPVRMLLYVLIMLGMPNMSEAVTVLFAIAANVVTFKTAFGTLAMLKRLGKRSHAVVTA